MICFSLFLAQEFLIFFGRKLDDESSNARLAQGKQMNSEGDISIDVVVALR